MKTAAPLLACLAAVACAGAGGVERSELPDAPIALLRRSEEDALRRVDAIRDFEKRQPGTTQPGVAYLESLDGIFGGRSGQEARLEGHQGQLALLDPRTGKTERLAGAPPQARPASWSPDRRRLLVSGTWRGYRQLFAWDRESGAVEIVSSGPAHHVNGCYAAGDRLVAVEVARESLVDAPSRLVASGPGGGALRPVGEEGYHFALACSPTRAQIAFVRIDPEEGRPRLLVQDLEPPGQPREVATGAAPVYTPDGDWIVYVAMTTKGSRLARVRHDGTGRTSVGFGLGQEGQPAVSPDGRYVAYVAVDAERRERIWVRRMDGSGDRPLLSEGDGSAPAW